MSKEVSRRPDSYERLLWSAIDDTAAAEKVCTRARKSIMKVCTLRGSSGEAMQVPDHPSGDEEPQGMLCEWITVTEAPELASVERRTITRKADSVENPGEAYNANKRT